MLRQSANRNWDVGVYSGTEALGGSGGVWGGLVGSGGVWGGGSGGV